MRAFCWIDFALDTIRLHKPEVGRRSQSTAKLYCLSHGTVFLRPPPQIALRFAAQINLEGQQKIQPTALWAVPVSQKAFPTNRP